MAGLIDLADTWLNVRRFELSVYCDNAKNFGFEIEGTTRKFAFRDGEYVDAFNMLRIR
jgi:L-phenylalanine/L-methionine N-acetyltransferase